MAPNMKNNTNNSGTNKYSNGRQNGVTLQKYNNQRQHNQKNQNKNQQGNNSKAISKQNRAGPKGGERAPGRKRHNYLPNIYASPRTTAFWDRWLEENFKVPDFSWVDYDLNLTSPLDPTPVDYASDDEDADSGWPERATLRTTCCELASHLLSHHKRLAKELDLQRNQKTIPKALDSLSLGSSFGFGSYKRIRLPSDMRTPTLDRFFGEITEHVERREGEKLQDFLQVVPPFRDAYRLMRDELQHVFPKGKDDAPLLKRCDVVLPKGRGVSSWPAFPVFLKLYLSYIRDVDIGNIPETYNALKALFNQGTLALGDAQLGEIMLPTVIYLCRVLSNFAGNIEASPELLSQFRRQDRNVTNEGTEKVTLVEQTANAARESFIKCLTDRSGTAGVNGKPEGKRKGIYLLANLCLKLLFRCGKLRNAEQMFASINAQSPPLDYFPASQRVTYLYYLGRYLFSNNLFYPAQKALQAAYDQCHRAALKQKHRILIYLIACNIIMSRFPSSQLLTRPEAEGLAERFVPLCRIIMSGDYLALHEHLAVGSPTAEWFQKKGILFQLKDRCEPLVWRSLTRKVFIYGGFQADPNSQNQKGPPPFLHLSRMEVAVTFIKARHSRSTIQAATSVGKSMSIQLPADSDFDGMNGFDVKIVNDPDVQDYFVADRYFDEKGISHDNAALEPLDREPDEAYTDQLDELNPYDDDEANSEQKSTLLREIESILSSLLSQNLLRGYLTHRNPRFAIPGARLRGALPTGFPNIWQTIKERESREGEDVPAWVRPRSLAQDAVVLTGAAGGGRVVNLKGAKPVGVQ